jgi:hypothetical protein
MPTDIDALIRKYEDKLLSLPNVRGVGRGEKAGKPVISVLVSHKVPDSSLRAVERIPRTLDGIETDVVEIGEPTAH